MNTPPTQTLLLKPDHAPANGMGTANGTTALNGSARNGDHNAHFDFEMIYSSPAALDAYLGSIHQRREQRKQEREKAAALAQCHRQASARTGVGAAGRR